MSTTNPVSTDNLPHRPINSFKAYDIRGELGVNLDEDIAYRIGRAFAQILANWLNWLGAHLLGDP